MINILFKGGLGNLVKVLKGLEIGEEGAEEGLYRQVNDFFGNFMGGMHLNIITNLFRNIFGYKAKR